MKEKKKYQINSKLIVDFHWLKLMMVKLQIKDITEGLVIENIIAFCWNFSFFQ